MVLGRAGKSGIIVGPGYQLALPISANEMHSVALWSVSAYTFTHL